MSMLLNSFAFTPPPSTDDYSTGAGIVMEFGSPPDEGPNALATMIRAAVSRNTASPKFGAAAWQGNAAANATMMAIDRTTMGLTTANFCVEMWVKNPSEPATGGLAGIWGTSGNRCWQFIYDATSNQFRFTYTTDGINSNTANYDLDTDGVTPATMWDGNWHHVAAVRNGSTVTVYVDGDPGAGTNAIGGSSIFDGGSQSFYIGSLPTSGSTPASPWAGEIDEFRLTVGVPRYTGAFSPPTATFGRNSTDDPDYTSVKFLQGFNARFGITQAGTVSDSLVMVTYGANDGPFSGDGIRGRTSFRYPYLPFNSEYNFGSGDFTIEVFGAISKTTAWDSIRQILGCWYTPSGQRSWRIAAISGLFRFEYSTTGSDIVTVDFADGEDADVPYDLTVVRKGTTLRLYKNGVLSTTHSIGAASLNDVSGIALPLGVACAMSTGFNSTEGLSPTNQRLKGFRINKGLGRFTGSSYTVPNPIPMV